MRYMLDNRFRAHFNIWSNVVDLFPLSAGSFLMLVDVHVLILLLWCDTALSVYAKSGQLASLTHTGSIVVVGWGYVICWSDIKQSGSYSAVFPAEDFNIHLRNLN